MINENTIPEEILELDNMVAIGYRGSIATGTFTDQTDDVDLWRLRVGSIRDYILETPHQRMKTIQTEDVIDGVTWDVVTYELWHFFSLLVKGNPNMIMLLMLSDDFIIQKYPLWHVIKGQQRHFLAVEPFYKSVTGFVKSQMDRIDNPGKPGGKPAKLVEAFGYNTHMASHVLRWAYMAKEYLETGCFEVDRSFVDSDDLIEVKNGKVSRLIFDMRLKYAMEDLEKVYKAGKFPIPLEPNMAEIDHLLEILVLQANREEIEEVLHLKTPSYWAKYRD